MKKVFYIVRSLIDNDQVDDTYVIDEVTDHVLIGDSAKDGYEHLPSDDDNEGDCIIDYELYTKEDCASDDRVKVAIEDYLLDVKLKQFLKKI